MSDHHSSLTKPAGASAAATTMISTLLGSPRFFYNGFFGKNDGGNISDHSPETACNNNHNLMSPTSILDAGDSDNHGRQRAIGLALVDSFAGEAAAANNRMVLLGSKLRVQIPISISPAEESPKSPGDFGIKTNRIVPPQAASIAPPTAKEFGRQLSLKEMEMSEDYTCVIIHGPNPKTTHIYDDCVVESVGVVSDQAEEMEVCDPPPTPANFLSFCCTCKKVLGQDRDVFIYRGDKAFCSEDCRCQEMVSEGRKRKDPDFEWCF